MLKNQRRQTNQQINIRKPDDFFSILFSLLTFYIALIGGIYSAISKLNQNVEYILAEGLFVAIPGMILIGVGVAVIFYFAWIILVALLELQAYYQRKTKRSDRIRDKLRKSVLSSPLSMIINIASVILYAFLLFFVYFKPWISYVLLGLTFPFLIVTLMFLRPAFIKKVISYNTIKEPKKSKVLFWYTIWYSVFVISSMFILFSTVIFHSSLVDIKFDKDRYFLNESAYVSINPKGIIKPILLNVTYSDARIPLIYLSDSTYGRAPIYVKIPEDIMAKHREPYNSYLQIEYKIPRFSWLFRENLTFDKFVPIFNETSPTEEQEVFVNVTYSIINNTVN